jgi:hypothetical protein
MEPIGKGAPHVAVIARLLDRAAWYSRASMMEREVPEYRATRCHRAAQNLSSGAHSRDPLAPTRSRVVTVNPEELSAPTRPSRRQI